MKIQSRHFGPIEIEDDKILQFPRGIVGFPEAKTFCLLNIPSVEPYQWLHCVNDPSLCFLVVPSIYIRPDYQIRLTAEERKILQMGAEDPLLVLLIVVMTKDVMEASADLLGPVVINDQLKVGAQIINDGFDYKAHHVIADELKKAREGELNVGAYPKEETVLDARR